MFSVGLQRSPQKSIKVHRFEKKSIDLKWFFNGCLNRSQWISIDFNRRLDYFMFDGSSWSPRLWLAHMQEGIIACLLCSTAVNDRVYVVDGDGGLGDVGAQHDLLNL